MQPLLDGPRALLSEADVRSLLQSHSAIQISYGATALDGDFTEVTDIDNYLVGSGSEIRSQLEDAVHRTCGLNIDGDVVDTGWSYLSGFIRPFMVITDLATGVAAQFNLGVYTLTTPARDLAGVGTLAFEGFDLNYLLRQAVGDSYEVPEGADPAQAAADAIGLAIPEVEVIVTPSDVTLPKRMSWPFDASAPTTWADIVNDLLATIGYREAWVDWDGHFRIEPYIDMQETAYEWVFDTGADDNIVADPRQQDIDIYDVPNWWRFVMKDQADTPVEGVSMFTWEDSSPVNPGSTFNRGRTIRYIEEVSVTDYDNLVGYAQRKIAQTLRPSETFTVKTAPFPLAWHLDVLQYLDEGLDKTLPTDPGGERRVVSTSWTLPLDGLSDMEWTWQTINDADASLGIATLDVS